MPFKKGHPNYNIKISQATKEKIRLSKIGAKNPMFGKAAWNKGKKGIHLSPKSEFKKGDKGPWIGKKRSPETVEKMRKANLGKKHTFESRRKMSQSQKRGKDHHNWKGGITKINHAIRTSLEYKLWRTAVFQRDNYTCIWCGDRNGNGKTVILHADHIKPFAYFPELRVALDNGRTLCIECHKTTDSFFKKKK